MSPKPLENLQSAMVTNAVGLQPVAVVGSTIGGVGSSVGGGGSTSTAGGGLQQQASDGGSRGGSISLAMLFDFIIQRTYHELTTLAEMLVKEDGSVVCTCILNHVISVFCHSLPSKSDRERKIEIYNFSARTRQLFIRLLALVKWANSASKVDKSAVS